VLFQDLIRIYLQIRSIDFFLKTGPEEPKRRSEQADTKQSSLYQKTKEELIKEAELIRQPHPNFFGMAALPIARQCTMHYIKRTHADTKSEKRHINFQGPILINLVLLLEVREYATNGKASGETTKSTQQDASKGHEIQKQ
jgi:hypothetical protein